MDSREPSAPQVLVVDDEIGVREVIREVLEDEGFQTVAARDGVEAIERLVSGDRPCLIVLDLMMPRMDGWEFASWLDRHHEHRSIPFVVITAHSARPKQDGLGRAAAILPKPLRLTQLVDIARSHCPSSSPCQ